jgi:drug/metabolite transporter (DMT)-like permease
MNLGLTKEFIGEIQLVLAVFFFALSFVYQKQAMINGMDPLVYNAYRYIVSSFFLWILKYIFKIEARSESEKKPKEDEESQIEQPEKNSDSSLLNPHMILVGIILGLANFCGSTLQQIGLVTVTAGKTGFITGMYVVFVPITEYFIPCLKAKLTIHSWIAAIVSMVGLYLLSGCLEQEICFGGAIKWGEVIVFISMFGWVISIIAADVGAKNLEVITLQFVDFFVSTIFNVLLAIIAAPVGSFAFQILYDNWLAVIIVGVSEAIAFTLSTMGQIYSTPSRAALLCSLEAVTTAFFSFLFLSEKLTYVEILGGTLMTLAAFISNSLHEEDKVEDNDKKEEQQENDSAESKTQQMLVTTSYSSPQNHRSSITLECSEASKPILKQNTSFGSIELTENSLHSIR